jgi:hypothetical protein
VTIDGFWIDDRDYWTLWYRAWLHFTVHYYTHTHTHTSVHSHIFTSRCSVATSNGGRSPCSGFPHYPRPQLPVSHSNSSQRLNLSSSLINSVTHQPTDCNTVRITLQLAVANWPCLQHLGTDHVKNAVPLLQCNCCVCVCWGEHVIITETLSAVVCRVITLQRLLYSCSYRRRCLAMVLQATIIIIIVIKGQATKMHGWMKTYLFKFLTSIIDGCLGAVEKQKSSWIKPRFLGRPACSLLTILTELSRCVSNSNYNR